jgi:hypothetical protein
MMVVTRSSSKLRALKSCSRFFDREYVHGLGHKLNDMSQISHFTDDNDRRIACASTPFQAAVNSIHLYPFVTVLERNTVPITELVAPKHGSHWQPFRKRGFRALTSAA